GRNGARDRSRRPAIRSERLDDQRQRTVTRVVERRQRMKVGFIGLGNMGSAIARKLIKAGHDLTVYNRTRSRAEPFKSLGAKIAGTPAEAAVDAEVLI